MVSERQPARAFQQLQIKVNIRVWVQAQRGVCDRKILEKGMTD
jgi:hypothetical protein